MLKKPKYFVDFMLSKEYCTFFKTLGLTVCHSTIHTTSTTVYTGNIGTAEGQEAFPRTQRLLPPKANTAFLVVVELSRNCI